MDWEATSSGRRGRQQTYSAAAIQACLTLKVLFGLPLRQTTGFVESLLKLVGLDWSIPDFSTLCRRQKTLSVAIPYKGSAGPLHLLVDSTGIKAEGEGEWNARKHGGSKRRLWRKIHIGIVVGNHELMARPEPHDLIQILLITHSSCWIVGITKNKQFQQIPLRGSNALQIWPPVVFLGERKLLNRSTRKVKPS